uniref:Putative secreted protein n=1 Tax=Anopheles marajoara TaxID=58244 RepID=A0A2M4C5U8_9DIPT
MQRREWWRGGTVIMIKLSLARANCAAQSSFRRWIGMTNLSNGLAYRKQQSSNTWFGMPMLHRYSRPQASSSIPLIGSIGRMEHLTGMPSNPLSGGNMASTGALLSVTNLRKAGLGELLVEAIITRSHEGRDSTSVVNPLPVKQYSLRSSVSLVLAKSSVKKQTIVSSPWLASSRAVQKPTSLSRSSSVYR